MKPFEQLSINTIRTLSLDAIDRANSGHPGLPLGAAPAAYVLWAKHLRHNPKAPSWMDRDRFVLSAGHGSMLLYSMLHLSGYRVSIEDLKNFRQWESLTPGHPEFGHTEGVETTTGPLGQGAANAVGMAIAERMLAHRFNRPGFELFNHYTYTLVGDGCLMEGISAEAASLAGHLGLGKLIYLYDSNDISLDGPTSLSFTEDVKKRFESYGWHYVRVEDGDTDVDAIDRAIVEAKKETSRPTLIELKTTIGYGSPHKAGSEKAHGAPFGDEETNLTKKALGWNHSEPFLVPEEVSAHFAEAAQTGAERNDEWNELFEKYKTEYPELAKELEDTLSLRVSEEALKALPDFNNVDSVATRKANGACMNAIAEAVPFLSGGDADLSCSTGTLLQDKGSFNGTTGEGRNIHFGVREHAMAAIANGMSYHGGIRPYTATFFSFVDYMRPSVRLAALTSIAPVFIFTHDSVAVGEDGPTHQPIEQLMSVRSMPNVNVIRPAEAKETAEAWRYILTHPDRPTALILTRQNLPTLTGNYGDPSGLQRGAYISADSENPEAIVIATGSELSIALEAYENLKAKGVNIRVVSMPSWEIFERQEREYRDSVLPPSITKRISVEAGVTFGWSRYVGTEGVSIGIDHFGASAPGDRVMKEFGFSAENIESKVTGLLGK